MYKYILLYCTALSFFTVLQYYMFTVMLCVVFHKTLELDANADQNEYIYNDKAEFYLAKRCCRGRNIIGERATVDAPGQRGGNVAMRAAFSLQGVIHHCITQPCLWNSHWAM